MDSDALVTTVELGGGQSEKTEVHLRASKPSNAGVEPPKTDNLIAQRGRQAWAMLHSYTGNDPQWVALWEHFIPQSSGCSCKENYKAILKDYPPDYTDSDSFFRWGWFLHNLVNEKLGKPLIELEEARRIWNRPEPTE